MYLLVYIKNALCDCFEFIYFFLFYPETTSPCGPWEGKFWAHFLVSGVSFSLFLASSRDSDAVDRDYFLKLNQPIDLCNGDALCFL
jgi:hypothetical protein